jgi:flavin reductase (DIM6/NTAB) family NADH-FMN oxidoreductase RutF
MTMNAVPLHHPGPATEPVQDLRALRRALGTFATGVTVVTAEGPEGPVGITANSFASVSLDPPLVLWSLARASGRFATFEAAKTYAIHVLAEDQGDVCARFARGAGRFDANEGGRNAQGAPILPRALARFDCRLHARVDGGDHQILIGRIEAVVHSDGAPLVFSCGQMGGFAPPTDAPGPA